MGSESLVSFFAGGNSGVEGVFDFGQFIDEAIGG
jgi:hypothetical protein